MAAHHSLFNMITAQQRVEVAQTLPGLFVVPKFRSNPSLD